jgi:adenylate cyclase
MAHLEAVFAGWTEFPADDLVRAEALAKKALSLDPATTKGYVLLGNIGLYRKEWDRALASIDQALAINPSDAECYQTRGAILTWSGNPAEAVRWLEAAQRFGELTTIAYMNLGIARYELGEYGESVATFDRMLALDPGRTQRMMAHPIRAAAYARLGKQTEMLRERAIVERMSPFFDAGRFAAQFGTEEARDGVLAGLHEAGFR